MIPWQYPVNDVKTAVATILLLFAPALPAATDADHLDGAIVRAKGIVSVNGKTAAVGTIVHAGDRIVAEHEESFAEIRFPSGDMVRVSSGRLYLAATRPDRFVVNVDSGVLHVSAGREANGEPRLFTVQTPTAVTGGREAKFLLRVSADETYLCVCDGQMLAQKKDILTAITARTTTVRAGEETWVRLKSSSIPPRQAPEAVDAAWKVFDEMGVEVPDRYRPSSAAIKAAADIS